jgi:hypothetical protein
MDFFDFFHARSGDKRRRPPLERAAESICRNLRALGLYARWKCYRPGFCEIVASTSPKMITLPGGAEASGIAILLAAAYDPPTLVFEQINSLRRGLGSAMVGAVVAGLREHPGLLGRLRVNDLSPMGEDGRRWWEHIALRYAELDWLITHEEDMTHLRKAD